MLDGDERDVVDLVHDVLARVPGDRGLELAGEVRERLVADEPRGDLVDLRRRVDELVGGDAGDGRAEDDARHVAARLGRAEADRLEAAPDLGHRLDLDPVQLDVLAVGEVGGVAAELGRDARR